MVVIPKTHGVMNKETVTWLYLDAAFSDLTVHPLMGRDCSDIRPGYRKYGIGKHLVFYRQIESEEIEIVRILHERMDVGQHL